jgi:hypothetical protein
MFRKFRSRTGLVLASAVIIGLLASSFAMASGEGKNLLLGKRNPGSNASAALTSETQIIANNSTYGTRQSNKSNSGGGAIYGCRSALGGTEKGNQPCVRSSNLSNGRAFEFSSNGGTEVGQITSGNANAAPFITNAHGVATGLNADQVDGKSADEIQKAATDAAHTDAVAVAQGMTAIGQVASDGGLGAKRGVSSVSHTGTGAYDVVFGGDISACAIQVTPATTATPVFAGATLGGDKKTVAVAVKDPAGTAADAPFHITVSC